MVMSPPWDNDDPDYEPMDYEFSRYGDCLPASAKPPSDYHAPAAQPELPSVI